MPIADGAGACPFVAFEDDRDERASVPDHRHRCYAEVRPAPRALAHQEAYCLSRAFPVCPTFQDWARRESARARDAAASAAAGTAFGRAAGAPSAHDDVAPTGPESIQPAAGPAAGAAAGVGAPGAAASFTGADGPDDAEPSREDAWDGDRELHDDGPRRNPPRDWSAPPPWLASAEAASGTPSEPPDYLAGRSDPGRGLAGSAADQLAGGAPPRPAPPSNALPADDPRPHREPAPDFEEHDLPRAAVPPRRPRAYDQHLGGPTSGPDWERPRRYEAYPTIKTRMALPSIPRLAGMAAAIAIAAVALFFLPALLGLGGDDEPGASPSPSLRPSQSIAPTPTPLPTPAAYIIKKGDTLSKVAVAHGITLEELLLANPDITDPNKIKEGQQITIPAPSPEAPNEFGGSAAPSAEASP